MPLAYNSERGEVPLTVGGVDLVIAAEMGRLADLSGKLGCMTFSELITRLAGGEPRAVMAALEALTVKGDWGKALKALSIRDLPEVRTAFEAALLHFARDREEPTPGKAAAAGETIAAFPGGNGSGSPASV